MEFLYYINWYNLPYILVCIVYSYNQQYYEIFNCHKYMIILLQCVKKLYIWFSLKILLLLSFHYLQ